MAMKMLKNRFYISGRAGLWLIGLLALAGCFWREPAASHPISAVVLAAWVELLIVLFRVPSVVNRNRLDGIRNEPVDDRISWIPVLLLGFLLPVRDMFVYFPVLGGVETIRFLTASFFIRRAGIVGPMPAIPVRDGITHPQAIEEIRTEPSGTVVQQLLRIRDLSGNDRLEGVFLVGFDENQETASVHVPFCPAFEKPPRVHAFTDEENGFRIIVHPPRIFGVRIDVKRSEPGIGAVRLCLTVVVPEADSRDR